MKEFWKACGILLPRHVHCARLNEEYTRFKVKYWDNSLEKMLFAANTLNPVSFVPEDLVTGKLSLIPLLKKTTNIYVNFQYAKTNKKQMNSLTTVPVPSNTPA